MKCEEVRRSSGVHYVFVSPGSEQASGSGPSDQDGRVGEACGRGLQAAGKTAGVQRHGRIPGHFQPETGNH